MKYTHKKYPEQLEIIIQKYSYEIFRTIKNHNKILIRNI